MWCSPSTRPATATVTRPPSAGGFGGPDGLAYLRSLDFVDKTNVGLEGHSMGGWTVLAAATAMPNDYKS